MPVTKIDIEKIANCIPDIVEPILRVLKVRLEKYKGKASHRCYTPKLSRDLDFKTKAEKSISESITPK